MTSQNTTSQNLTLRLLNGLLNGVEFSLQTGRTLFCVGDAQAFDAGERQDELALARASDALFIPGNGQGPNFTIEVGGEYASGDFSIEILSDPVRHVAGEFQQLCQAGALLFAVKPADATWNDAVLNRLDVAATVTATALPPVTPAAGVPRPSAKWILPLAVVLSTALAGVAGWAYWHIESAPRQETTLARLLQGGAQRYAIRQGKDKVFYVLAHSETDAIWARQALSRQSIGQPVRVLTAASEQARIEHLLDERKVNFFAVRMDDPLSPAVVLSAERNGEMPDLQAALLAAMPYARTLDLNRVADATVVADAQARLDKLALHYEKRETGPDGVVFVLSGDLADSALNQLQGPIAEFEHAYGTRYVRFVLELREDWLKGKSFKYGADGYVQLSSTHWYFPKPL